jgi:hypothetical protein
MSASTNCADVKGAISRAPFFRQTWMVLAAARYHLGRRRDQLLYLPEGLLGKAQCQKSDTGGELHSAAFTRDPDLQVGSRR